MSSTERPGSSLLAPDPAIVDPERLRETIHLIPGYNPCKDTGGAVFDAQRGAEAIRFFHECLTHVKGEKALEPLILEPWQQAIIANFFGWLMPDGTRRYKESLVYVPRKNGKTTISAGVPLFVLFCDPERGKEIYAAAADKKQAAILFGIAKRMIYQESAFEGHADVLKYSITREYDGSFFQPISADADTKHGYNASAVVIDELHAQKNSDLVEVLETSVGSRRQPIMLSITTADMDLPVEESVCNRKHKYASDVRDGHISDPEFLPVIYEADVEKDDWKDPAVWRKANPNWDVSLFPSYFERKFRQAMADPVVENGFKRLHLNMRTQQAVRWMRLEDWDASSLELEPDALLGRKCYGGLDLATIEDIAALVLLFELDDDTIGLLPFFWVPEDSATDREARSRAKYITWANEGLVELTPGNAIDFDFIRKRLNELKALYRICDIGFDPWNAHQITSQLVEKDGFQMTPTSQGYKSMSSPMKCLKALTLAKKIRHGKNRVLRWMIGNVAADRDVHENIKPNKKKSTEKIDGVVALIMAIGVSGLAEERNPYVGRGALSI